MREKDAIINLYKTKNIEATIDSKVQEIQNNIGAISIVNDLTTGGTNKSLSAEQGKVVNETLLDIKKHGLEWINVKLLGAIGDEVADDTIAFTNAIATGKPIYIPFGVYRVKNLAITNKAFFIMQGDNATLKVISDDDTKDYNILSFTNVNNLKLSGITFLGNGCNIQDSFNKIKGRIRNIFTNVNSFLIENIVCKENIFSDLFNNCSNGEIRSSYFYDNDCSIIFMINPSRDIRIHDNYFYGGTSEGVSIYDATQVFTTLNSNIKIYNNTFDCKGNNGNCILITSSENIHVYDNELKSIDTIKNTGINLYGTNKKIRIINNVFDNIYNRAITIGSTTQSNATDVTIDGNIIKNNYNTAIRLYYATNVLFKNNILNLKNTIANDYIMTIGTNEVTVDNNTFDMKTGIVGQCIRVEVDASKINILNNKIINDTLNTVGIKTFYGTGLGNVFFRGNTGFVNSIIQSNISAGDKFTCYDDIYGSIVPQTISANFELTHPWFKSYLLTNSTATVYSLTSIGKYGSNYEGNQITIVAGTSANISISNTATYLVKTARTLTLNEIVRFVYINGVYREI